MDHHHIILCCLWIGYCLMHSLLALPVIKKSMESAMGKGFRYYRLLYSIFAFATLAGILFYQYSFKSELLFGMGFLWFFPYLIASAGLVIMLFCVRKYFYELSGIKALSPVKSEDKNILMKNGLHAYVRHPLYLGTLLFVWGLFILFPFLNNLIAVVVITVYTFTGIQLEEKKLLQEFGEEYRKYKKEVPMLIPKFS